MKAPCISRRVGIVVISLLPVLLLVIWTCLDANPTLFLYDCWWMTAAAVASAAAGKGTASAGAGASYHHHHNLQGKSIWITGASSGIGAAMVCQIIEAGAFRIILSSRNTNQMQQVVSNCLQQQQQQQQQNPNPMIHIVHYDAMDTNQESIEATVDQVMKLTKATTTTTTNNNHPHHGIDILILNAGVYQSKPALMTTQQERDWIMRVNYQAPVELVQTFIQHQNQCGWKETKRTKKAHIVVVASVMSFGPHGLSSSYAASKAALKSYFQSLSTEEASWLRVDVACPGATDTGLWMNSNINYHNKTSSSNNNNKNKKKNGGDETHQRQQDRKHIIPSTQGSAKMSPERVAHLILTGVAGPRWLFYETWISKMEGLIWVWLSHYMPTLFYWSVHSMGYVRKRIWEHEQMDALDLSVLIHRSALILVGKYPPVISDDDE